MSTITARSGARPAARTVAGAELQQTASGTYRPAIRRKGRSRPWPEVTVLVVKITRSERSQHVVAVLGRDDAALKRTYELAQLPNAPGAGSVEVCVEPCQSARAGEKPPQLQIIGGSAHARRALALLESRSFPRRRRR